MNPMYNARVRPIKPLFGPVAFGFVLFILSDSLLALPEDHQQPLLVRADSVDLNQKKHLGIYIGHVTVDQGSTHIRATKAVTEGDENNQLVQAVIEGDSKSQAHYWTLQNIDKPELHAYADTMYYYPKSHQILLDGHAYVLQDHNKITASKLYFDTLTQHVKTSYQGAQTTITILPTGNDSLEYHP